MRYMRTFENNSGDGGERFARELMKLSEMFISNIDKVLKKINIDYYWHFKGFVISKEGANNDNEEISLEGYIVNVMKEIEESELTMDDVKLRQTIIIKKHIPEMNGDDGIYDDVYDDAGMSVNEWILEISTNMNILKSIINDLSPKYSISYIDYNHTNKKGDINSILIMIDYDLSKLSNSIGKAMLNINK
tara:strand:+ start:569 stop:1138 length:570 start_codon:yes stop_codon:yes gene_type:complete